MRHAVPTTYFQVSAARCRKGKGSRRVAIPAIGRVPNLRSARRRVPRRIRTMLDVARARLAGGIVLVRKRTDLNVVVQQALQDLDATYPQRQVDVICTGNATGDWDTDRLLQVVTNLAGNALQHGTDGGVVTVSIDGRDAAYVRLCVENAGSIPPGLLEHVTCSIHFAVAHCMVAANPGSASACTSCSRSCKRTRVWLRCSALTASARPST